MSLKIRLTRMGSHKKPFYRVVVAQSSSPRDGKYVAKLGTYNPFLEENKFKLDINDVKDWIKKGKLKECYDRSYWKEAFKLLLSNDEQYKSLIREIR